MFRGTNILLTTLAIASVANAQKVYWTDRGADKVQRADLDGLNVEDVVTGTWPFPQGIALDLTAGKIYWVSNARTTNARIQRADLE